MAASEEIAPVERAISEESIRAAVPLVRSLFVVSFRPSGPSHSRGQRQLPDPTHVLFLLYLTPINLPCESRARVVTGSARPSRQTNMMRISTRERAPSGASITGA